jgi:hypothetical protein
MSFETTVRAFAAALGEPSAPAPATTHGRLGAPDARRFAVYRNNVAVGLIGALEARYPVSRRLAGDHLFRAIARTFVRANKPRSPVMISYGAEFPEFVADFLGAVEAGFAHSVLVDVARLENAWVEAYHSEDAVAATVGDLAALGPDCLPDTRIAFHPAARLMRFATSAATVWTSAQSSDGPATGASSGAEDALITRPDCDVHVRVLPPHAYDFAQTLREGATLIEAVAAVNDPAFDFGTHLVGLVESGAIASIMTGPTS